MELDDKPAGPDDVADENQTTDDGNEGEHKDKPAQPPEMTEDEKRLEAAKNKKLAGEAAAHRIARQKAEEERDKANTARMELEKKLEELTKAQAHPQGHATEDEGEMAGLRRQVAELQVLVKASNAKAEAAEQKAKAEKISGHIARLVSEGDFRATKALSSLLEKVVVLDDDGLPIINVKTDEGVKIKVAATVANLMEYKPIDDFDDFVKSKGSPGSGSGRPGNGKLPADGIDRKRVEANDVQYIQANLDKITELKRAGKF